MSETNVCVHRSVARPNAGSRAGLRFVIVLALCVAFGALAEAQEIRIVSVSGVGETSSVFFTAHLLGEVKLSVPWSSLRPVLPRPPPRLGAFYAFSQEPYQILWNFGDGTPEVNTGERPNITHVFGQQGTYEVSVELRNKHGLISSHSSNVTINNAAPSIYSIGVLKIDQRPRTVELSSWVDDTPKDTLTYSWDFGDGNTEEGVDLWRTRHRWAEDGEYKVTLRVSDEDGGESDLVEAQVRIGEMEESAVSVAPGEAPPQTLAVTSFSATTTGGISTNFEGRIKPPAGLYLKSTQDGVCRFMLSAWDPSLLANIMMVADLRDLGPRGARYQLNNFQFYAAFQHTLERYRAQEYQGQVQGNLGSALRGLAAMGGLPADVREALGVDPNAVSDQKPDSRAAPGRSPFGLADSTNFEYAGGKFELVMRPHDRADAEFDLVLVNTDPKGSPRTLNMSGRFTLNLQSARAEGVVSYEGCSTPGFSITHTSPVKGARHVHTTVSPRVVFDEPYDPATLDDTTFEVGYLDTNRQFVAVEGRILRNERDARFLPVEPFLGGVRYEARIKTGEQGVRGKNGKPLPDDAGLGYHPWSFFTEIIFRSVEPKNNLACHLFQTVRDAPLVKGKPAVARIYADWSRHPNVLESDQVESFIGHVKLKDAYGKHIYGLPHEFVRPDLWRERQISLSNAKHTANVFGWTPTGSEGSQPIVTIEAETTPGKWQDVYHTRCPATYWKPEPRLTIDYYHMPLRDAAAQAAVGTMHSIYLKGQEYALQLFPLQSIRGRFQGTMSLGIAQSRAFQVGLAIHRDERDKEKVISKFAGELALAYAKMRASAADLVLGFARMDGGATLTSVDAARAGGVAGAIYMGFAADKYDDSVEGWVHEVGHFLRLEHIPYIFDEKDQKMMMNIRVNPGLQYDGIEGFRIVPSGRSGWNKSSREGNGEAARLMPLMFPATLPYRQAFIATHHYHQIQWDIEKNNRFAMGNRRGAPIQIASTGGGLMLAASQNAPAFSKLVGIAGVLSDEGDTAWIGPLVPGSLQDNGGNSGEYEISLLNAAGSRISSSSFEIASPRHRSGGGVFSASVSWSDQARSLVLSRGDTVLARRDRTAHPPAVRLTAPTSGQKIEGKTTLSWTSSDADGDSLSATVLYSSDGGADGWSTVALWLEESSFTIDTSMLEPGANPTFRVVVSDGFDEGEAQVSVKMKGRLTVLAALPSADVPADPDGDLLLMFNSDLASAGAAKVTLHSGGEPPIATELRYEEGARTLIVVPATPLEPGKSYRATLEGTLVNHLGDRLSVPYTWSFSTAVEVK
jgi:hypothetical protein